MGIADAIPGISGGTIALLLGIYEELIGSISNFNINLFQNLKNKGINIVGIKSMETFFYH